MSTRQRHCLHRQRGLAAVEMAICTPLLLLLMLATAEFGRALFQYNTLAKAVRDGVRYASSQAAAGSTGTVAITDEIRQNTRNLVVTGSIAGFGAPALRGFTAENVTVTNVGGGFLSVSATYTYLPMIGPTLPTFGLGDPIQTNLQFTATVVMRALL